MMTADMQEQLRVIMAKERFHKLELAYCRAIDRPDKALLHSIFFDDAVEDHGDAFQGTARSYVEYVLGGLLDIYELTAHYVLNEWYEVRRNEAEGEVHRVSYIVNRPT